MHTHSYQKNIYYWIVDELMPDFYLEKLSPIMYLDIVLKLKRKFHTNPNFIFLKGIITIITLDEISSNEKTLNK